MTRLQHTANKPDLQHPHAPREPAQSESGASNWEAVNRLVAGHRALLERRWSAGAARS